VKLNGYALIVFVGTRRDKQQFDGHRIQVMEYANSLHQKGATGTKVMVTLVSAKTGENVKNTFRDLATKINHRDAVEADDEILEKWCKESVTSFVDKPMSLVKKSKGKFQRKWNKLTCVENFPLCCARPKGQRNAKSSKSVNRKPNE